MILQGFVGHLYPQGHLRLHIGRDPVRLLLHIFRILKYVNCVTQTSHIFYFIIKSYKCSVLNSKGGRDFHKYFLSELQIIRYFALLLGPPS